MTTYTDPRLLDTAAAVESLPSFDPRTVAPLVAPKTGKRGKPESLPDHSVEFANDRRFDRATKTPRDSRGYFSAAERTQN
jgi:hypothetical protein